MRNQKGVSMITLVITIIVVIILAAITLSGGALDSITQGQFSGFASEVAGVQEAVDIAVHNANADEVNRGNTRTTAQLYNFIARGGYNTVDEDSKWLVGSDAAAIPCTLINKEFALDSIGVELPVRKVETYKGTNQEVSFYITPKGQVFCWPPYMYQGASYITGDITIKSGDKDSVKTASGDALEFAETDATMYEIVYAYFPGTNETIAINNIDVGATGAIAPTVLTRGDATGADFWNGTANAAVIYRDVAVSGDRGVAEGIDFSDYDNTIR